MTRSPQPVLAVVVPCYNEAEVIAQSCSVLRAEIARLASEGLISPSSAIHFVDDGSRDATWSLIAGLAEEYDDVHGIKLSRNAGHQNALLAGLLAVRGQADIVISLDADLQDDVTAMVPMIEQWREGAEIVYAVRSTRRADTVFKRSTAGVFYRVMEWLGAETVRHHADYRLMTAKALDALAEFDEVNLFLRGIIPLLGFPSSVVEFERAPRAAGETKYPFGKMVRFAADGITAFTTRPLHLMTIFGAAVSVIAVLVMSYSLIQKLAGNTVPGWTFTTVSIWFIGGVQMLGLGILGEYLGKTYAEVKRRPRYIVERQI